jgi:predicted N-acetyltransferase YhbS
LVNILTWNIGVVWAQLWRHAPEFSAGARLTGDGSAPYGPPLMTTPPFSAESTDVTLRFAPERPQDCTAVDALIDRAFGPGRRVKSAERLREHNLPALDLSLAAWAGSRIVGCVRMWPIHIGDAPAILLGPFAVDDAWRSRGLGSDLVRRACEGAQAAGHAIVLLVGDDPFFTKLGFETVSAGRVTLPGPVDPRRLLWRALKPGATDGVEGRAHGG